MQPRLERIRAALERRADEDEMPLTVPMIRRLAEAALHPVTTGPGAPARRTPGGRELTAAHAEAILGLACGLTPAQIAHRLRLSPRAVRARIRQAIDTLDARTPAHAVGLLVGMGLIDPAHIRLDDPAPAPVTPPRPAPRRRPTTPRPAARKGAS